MEAEKRGRKLYVSFSDVDFFPPSLSQGPVFTHPLKEPKDVEKLNVKDVLSRLAYVLEAISLTRHKLEGKVPLIGFVGAPVIFFSTHDSIVTAAAKPHL